MKCQFCENEVPPNVNNCPCCGAPVPQQFVQPQPAPQHSWQSGGQPQRQPGLPGDTASVSTRSRMTYVLLGTFLGALGIHNFYIGRTKTGIAQIVITILFATIDETLILLVFVWVLIELFTVKQDADNLPLQ